MPLLNVHFWYVFDSFFFFFYHSVAQQTQFKDLLNFGSSFLSQFPRAGAAVMFHYAYYFLCVFPSL